MSVNRSGQRWTGTSNHGLKCYMKELKTRSIILATGMRQEQRNLVENQALSSRMKCKHVEQRGRGWRRMQVSEVSQTLLSENMSRRKLWEMEFSQMKWTVNGKTAWIWELLPSSFALWPLMMRFKFIYCFVFLHRSWKQVKTPNGM